MQFGDIFLALLKQERRSCAKHWLALFMKGLLVTRHQTRVLRASKGTRVYRSHKTWNHRCINIWIRQCSTVWLTLISPLLRGRCLPLCRIPSRRPTPAPWLRASTNSGVRLWCLKGEVRVRESSARHRCPLQGHFLGHQMCANMCSWGILSLMTPLVHPESGRLVAWVGVNDASTHLTKQSH